MYYSLQVGTDRFIISSEPLTLGDKEFKTFPDYRTFIYTTGCLLAGDVKAQELHLHTASFTTSGTPTFNLAGKDGKNATSGDSSIADGTKGRDFYFSSANFEYKSRFKVNAKGGNGGRGYDNALSQKGGTGGKGGDGGNVKIMYEDTYQVAIDGYDSYDDAISAENPDEDTIKLVAKAWIEDLHVVVKDPKKVTEKIQYLYGELEKTDEYGHPKITISLTDLEAKIEDLKRALEDLKPGDGMAGDLEDGINCAGGARGTGGDGDPRGDPGQRGNDGSYDVYNDMDDDAIWDSEELLFHPDQISIIFRDAYAEYFRGAGENGSENIQTCATLLGQLLQRLAFLDDIDPNDSSSKANSNMWKAYKHREADILVLPSSDDKPTTIKTLQTVYKKAQTYMAQLTSGQDIFGHSPSWVPRGSFEFYQTQVNQVLKSFGDIETNYQAYKKRDWKQKSKLQWILDGISSANAAIENITLHQTTIAKLIPPLIEDIKTLNAQIPVKKTHLLNSIKEVEKQIKDHDGVSLKEFLDSAVSFAFQPGPAMGIIVGGKIWRDSSQGIEDDAGNLVDKSFLINQLEEIDGTVAGLKEGIALTNAGSLDPEDAGGAKLIAAREALMNLISSYKDVISEWKVIKNQFDDYINTVISRNNKALQYNQYIISWLQDEFSIQQQNDTIDKLQKKGLDTIDPEIPAVAAFVEQSYYSTVDQILKILYMAERALAFWAVELPLDNFDTVRRSGIDGGGLSASLSSLQTKILSEYSTAVEQSTSAYQKFGNWIGTGNGSGPNVPLVYQLSDDEWNPFTTGDERISVNMSNTYAEVTKDANIFLGRYDVRLVNVRFFLEGDLAFYDESGDMSVRASLRHNGFETIVDSNNGPNSFEHSILDFEFSYVHPFDSHNPQILTEGNMFDSPNPSKLSFALFGPFTVWDIYITKDWNPNLDMGSSQISGARLEFTGWSKTVSP